MPHPSRHIPHPRSRNHPQSAHRPFRDDREPPRRRVPEPDDFFTAESRRADDELAVALRQIQRKLDQENLRFLAHCIDFWRLHRPDTPLKQWLEFSLRQSTHRTATDGLCELIARLSAEQLVALAKAYALLERSESACSDAVAITSRSACE